MTSPATPRFDSTWASALRQAAQAAARFGLDVVVARDHLGRASLLLDDRGPLALAPDNPDLATAKDAFKQATHPFTGLEPLLLGHLMFAPELYFDTDDRMEVSPRRDPGTGAVTGSVHVLERTAIGTDWTRPTTPAQSGAPTAGAAGDDWDRRDRRVSLFGFKGGVGRSTATAMLARYLAEQGRCVLVVDLDLESPGVSNLLEGPDGIPQHGIVDHLVEAGVGNDTGLELVARATALPVRGQTNGEVWLAPAGGRPRAKQQDDYDYLAKLNRIYSDLAALTPGGPRRPFSSRLDQAISACEDQVAHASRRPDVVLLDCRAGLHDIAAVVLTHLSGLVLLFAVDNPSTWEGYRMLFEQWRRRPDQARGLVERLRIVAAMFHSAGDVDRLPKLREEAYLLLSETLYDPDDLPQLGSEESPHWAVPILFGNDLIGLNPLRSRAWPDLPLVEAAYQTFTTTVEKLLPPPHPESR